MKRNLAYLLVSALLVFSLTACGCTATPQDAGGANNSTQEENSQSGNTQNGGQNGSQSGGQNGGQGSDSQNGGSSVIGNGGNSGNGGGNSSSGSTVEEGMDNIQNGVDNAIDDITGTDRPADGGVPFDEMLENGKVKE